MLRGVRLCTYAMLGMSGFCSVFILINLINYEGNIGTNRLRNARLAHPTPENPADLKRSTSSKLMIDVSTAIRSICKNTKQGRFLVTDSNGYMCPTGLIDASSNCCNTGVTTELNPKVRKHVCDTCESGGCCSNYEECVSCCLKPANGEYLRDLEGIPSFLVETGNVHFKTGFDVCAYKCRTNSNSVQSENSYRSTETYCYTGSIPQLELLPVNSDFKGLVI